MKRLLIKLASLSMILSGMGCSGPSIEKRVTLDITATAISLVQVAGGGYFVAVEPAVVFKLDNNGNVQWKFEQASNNVVNRLTMVSALADGGAIICGERHAIKDSVVTQFPGFVIRLDAHGKEVARLGGRRT